MSQKRRKNAFDNWTTWVISLAKLIFALKYCILAVASFLACIQILMPQNSKTHSPPNVLPGPCHGAMEKVLHLSDYAATDALFFKAHPERNGALITVAEPDTLKKEWWDLYDRVITCKNKKR